MAVVDMSLNELRNYKGINPCPTDFDEYWDRALAEMQAVNADIEITPACFSCDFADCYDMYYTGVEGLKMQKDSSTQTVKNLNNVIKVNYHRF